MALRNDVTTCSSASVYLRVEDGTIPIWRNGRACPQLVVDQNGITFGITFGIRIGMMGLSVVATQRVWFPIHYLFLSDTFQHLRVTDPELDHLVLPSALQGIGGV